MATNHRWRPKTFYLIRIRGAGYLHPHGLDYKINPSRVGAAGWISKSRANKFIQAHNVGDAIVEEVHMAKSKNKQKVEDKNPDEKQMDNTKKETKSMKKRKRIKRRIKKFLDDKQEQVS